MPRLTWTHHGIAAIGDKDGPIHVWTTWYHDRLITKYQPTKRRPTYYVDGADYDRLADVLQAIDTERDNDPMRFPLDE